MSKNKKNWGKLMKIANIDGEFLHIFWTTWGNSMKFSGEMYFKKILKVTKNQGSILAIEDAFFKIPQHRHIRVKKYFRKKIIKLFTLKVWLFPQLFLSFASILRKWQLQKLTDFYDKLLSLIFSWVWIFHITIH